MPSGRKQKPKPDLSGLPRIVGEFDVARMPFAGSSSVSTAFLDETIKFWQPQSERILTREDAREMVENVTGFFNILHEWYEAERLTEQASDEINAAVESSAEIPKQGSGRRNDRSAMP
jgi:hypothetical protein